MAVAQDSSASPDSAFALSVPQMAELSQLTFWGEQPGSIEFVQAQDREIKYLPAKHQVVGFMSGDAYEAAMLAHAQRPKAGVTTFQIITKAVTDGIPHRKVIEVYQGMMVQELKLLIKDVHAIPVEVQRLVHNCQPLLDEDTVDCIGKEGRVDVMLGLRAGAPKERMEEEVRRCSNNYCHLFANYKDLRFTTCCQTCPKRNLHTSECVKRQTEMVEVLVCAELTEPSTTGSHEVRDLTQQGAGSSRDAKYGSRGYWESRNAAADARSEILEMQHQSLTLYRTPPPWRPSPCVNLNL